MGDALEAVGCSITLTSLTDGLAFYIGSLIDLPAVSAFCVAAGMAVFSVFIIQSTFFAAMVVLDARREQANRLDLAPCIKRRDTRAPHTGETVDALVSFDEVARELGAEELQKEEVDRGANGEVDGEAENGGAVKEGADGAVADGAVADGAVADGAVAKAMAASTVGRPETGAGRNDDRFQPRLAARVLQYLGDLFLRDWRRRLAAGLCFGMLALGMGLNAYSNLSRGTNWSTFLPSGSYVLDFLNAGTRGCLYFVAFLAAFISLPCRGRTIQRD
jgi:hypothetical protein